MAKITSIEIAAQDDNKIRRELKALNEVAAILLALPKEKRLGIIQAVAKEFGLKIPPIGSGA